MMTIASRLMERSTGDLTERSKGKPWVRGGCGVACVNSRSRSSSLERDATVLWEVSDAQVSGAGDRAGDRWQEPAEAADEGGLARAIGSEDSQRASGAHVELVHAHDRALAVAEESVGCFY